MRKYIVLILASALLMGCGSSRRAVEIADRVTHDTLYLNKVQYDSIYINDGYAMDFRPSKEFVYLLDSMIAIKVDTMYIHDKQLEYKYKYLHDTTYVHKVDTIPVIKTVTEVQQVKYVPWYAKAFAWIGVISLLLVAIWIATKYVFKR